MDFLFYILLLIAHPADIQSRVGESFIIFIVFYRPKIGKARSSAGPATVRRHNRGCNCKRSGCLKNYCECYEVNIYQALLCPKWEDLEMDFSIIKSL